jgi:STE24 endopeptidase
VNEDKGTRYRRAERGLMLLEVAAAGAVVLAVACSPAPVAIAARIRAASGLDAARMDPPGVLDGLMAAAVLAVTLGLAGLAAAPFANRRHGVLASRYNLPVVSPLALVRERIRHGAVVVVAGAGAWWLFARLAHMTTWLAGIGTAAGVLVAAAVVMLLAPWLILLSPRVRPVRDEAVSGRLHALASRAGLRLAGLHEWVFDAEGDHANAALVGVVGPRRLLLSDTLIAGCPPEEMEAVVAHELGHHAHGHTWLRVRAQAVVVVLAALGAQLFAAGPARWVGGTGGITDPASVAWMLVGAGLAWLAARPWLLAQSRQHEAEADAFALGLTGRPDVLERVLARLGARNLASEEDSLLTRAFFLTHPPIPTRIAAARRAARPEL